ncbi:MFS general substrate transporter [Corynespora cassiicola Philippines]|uniref:MFS general substrate transporter n=1 Tax=Corynespora cassiicola Philippines TaxID=1448308 RepID=A0A2T2N3V8_CORCC|nr:MFS general substrate transporter [Corynespora cassiicola Philippines]
MLAQPMHKDDEMGLLDADGRDEKRISFDTALIEDDGSWKNLPHKKQIFLLSLCRLSTPLSNACLLPYLYYLVKSVLSDPDHPSAPQEISRLTGLLVAAYPLGQMMTSMLWGRVSDTYGRKPAILVGLAVSVISNLAFGFSRTIAMLFFWRVLAGMANGILGVMRTMTAEIVRERKFQTRAFLAPPLVFNSGRVAALAIGGCLADPVDNMPFLFGPSGIFNVSNNPDGVVWTLEYPYALPALFNGTVLAICLVCAVLWLRESLPSRRGRWDLGLAIGCYLSELFQEKFLRKKNSGYTAVQAEESDDNILEGSVSTTISPVKQPTPFPFSKIWTRPLIKALVAFALLPLHNSTFLHILPVFLSMPASPNPDSTVLRFRGGLGLASPIVGLYLAAFGICGIFLQLFIYPRLQKRIGTLGAFRAANAVFPITYTFAPYLSLLSGHATAKWIAMAAILFTQVMARTMAIPSTVILLTEAAPRRSVLGTVHGAGNTLSAMASALGPVIGGCILARGMEIGMVGIVWWGWLCLIALVALAWSFVLRIADFDDDGKEGAVVRLVE